MQRLVLENETIEYEIVRKKTKNITIKVKHDGTVSVTANKNIAEKYVEKFIEDKLTWINSIKSKINNKVKLYLDVNYVGSECIDIMGKKYYFQLQRTTFNSINNTVVKRSISITIDGALIIVDVKGTYTDEDINQRIAKWLDNMANDAVAQSLIRIFRLFEEGSIPFPKVRIRNMSTRWGTCSIYGELITINKLLIHLPVELLDYVVAHELAHFVHGDHSKNFYALLSTVMPLHKVYQDRLKNYMIVKK